MLNLQMVRKRRVESLSNRQLPLTASLNDANWRSIKRLWLMQHKESKVGSTLIALRDFGCNPSPEASSHYCLKWTSQAYIRGTTMTRDYNNLVQSKAPTQSWMHIINQRILSGSAHRPTSARRQNDSFRAWISIQQLQRLPLGTPTGGGLSVDGVTLVKLGVGGCHNIRQLEATRRREINTFVIVLSAETKRYETRRSCTNTKVIISEPLRQQLLWR